jgi:hypothetical protein
VPWLILPNAQAGPTMGAASMVMLSREPEPSSKKTSKGLRVNQPGDAFEREADRVADTVSAGGHIPGWALASTGADQIQRDSNTASALPSPQPIRQIGDPQDPPASNNYGDMLGKLAEALLQTSAGKTIVKYLTDQPIVQDTKDFIQTPQGVVVAGSTAIAAISGLAAAHKGLPIQIPAIPLDKLHAGLKMKINVEGPLDRPTQGSLMFSFEGAPPKKKKGAPTDRERFQAETARIAEEQQKFRAGKAPAAQQQQADEQLARKAELRRLSNILQPGVTHKPGEFTPLVPGTQPLSLHMRDADRIPATETTDKDKKEEIPVQRMAERAYDNEQEAAPEIESVISSSGRPLDRETRRYMEPRIGFDFSKVRIHTDSCAAASAKSLNPRAYTVGNNIAFGAGRFAPNTMEGRRLLAHELTHTVQLARSQPHVDVLPAGKPRDKFEIEANEFGETLIADDNMANAGTLEIIPLEQPLTLFVWSKNRVVPIRLTEFSITEEAFDTSLNPIRAKVSLGMRVLTVDDLGFQHPGGHLFMAYLSNKEALAAKAKSVALTVLGLGGLP